MGEATIKYKKASETRVDIQVEMKHYETNTLATYKKYIALIDNGSLQHYPIKEFAVQGVAGSEYNTVKKYFTHILGEEGYKGFKEGFLNEFSLRLEIELNWFIKRTK